MVSGAVLGQNACMRKNCPHQIFLIAMLAILPYSSGSAEEPIVEHSVHKHSALVANLSSTTTTRFDSDNITDLVIRFSLRNTGEQAVVPDIEHSALIIDGSPIKNSNLLLANVRNEPVPKPLSAGQKLEFLVPMGHYLSSPGEHILAWRSAQFGEATVKIKVATVGPWKSIAANNWADVSVERKLYKRADSKKFYVHIKIRNLSSKLLGFESTTRFSSFYINQWAESMIGRRQIISEMRRLQNDLSGDEKKALQKLFASTKGSVNTVLRSDSEHERASMIKLAPHSDFDYYVPFDGGNYDKAEAVKLPYLILVMDGRMGLTDGNDVCLLRREQSDSSKGEVSIASPIKLQSLPSNGCLLFDE